VWELELGFVEHRLDELELRLGVEDVDDPERHGQHDPGL